MIGYKKRELVAKREETATPRAPVTPATPVAPAAPLSTNLEALKSLFTGSRWECFSSPNLVGRPYWVEFYRDGKMYSEWSEAYHWEIIPPSAIKITGGNSGKTEWVLVVDAAKKEGRPDPNLNRGGARSIRYLKSISANPPKGVKF